MCSHYNNYNCNYEKYKTLINKKEKIITTTNIPEVVCKKVKKA